MSTVGGDSSADYQHTGVGDESLFEGTVSSDDGVWGNTTNRTLFKGHIHTDRKVEYMTSNETAGFIEKSLPSLGKTDYYHYSNKYTCNRRSGKLEIQHPTMGNICELTYQAL